MTTLVLLRHGQTDWNLYHRYQGLTDIPLNVTGEEQARNANALLKSFQFDAVYCSDLDRAKRTAKLALEGIYPYNRILFDRRLRERSFGTYEGGPFDKENLPAAYRTSMEADPENFKFPEGESLCELKIRVASFYDEIIRKHKNDTVLVVAHGSLLSMFFFIAANEPVNDKKRIHLKNAEPMILKID